MSVSDPTVIRWPPAVPEHDARTDAEPTPRARRLQARLALPLIGLGAWAFGVSRLRPTGIGDYGLLGSGTASVLIAAGLLLLLAGFLLELGRSARPWLLGLQLVGLIVAIHATVPIVFGAPEYAWVYKHVGIAAALQQYGHVTDPTNIYQEWPSLFAALASISSLAHTNPLSFARWAPLAFELGDALLLMAIFRLLVGERRIVWLAILVYEGLISWVGQDYLSPQAFAYLLWLGAAYIILRWLRRPAAGTGSGRLARWRAPLTAGLEPAPEASRAIRAAAVVLVAVLYTAITTAHQLTPYMALAAVAALTILNVIRPRWLVLMLAAVAGGYLALHYQLIAQQFGGLFSGGNPLANAGGATGTPDASLGAITTSRIVDALMGVMWLSSTIIVIRRRHRLGQVAIPAALAFSPFVILLAQSYGGEAIYRVYLFSAPWCALIIAGAVWRLRPRRRWAMASLATMAILFGGVQGLYGPVLANAFTPREVNASLWLYTHVPRGSLIVLPVDNFPGLESSHYNSYDLQVLPADPQVGPAWMDEGNLTEVQRWLAGQDHRTAYVVVSRSMNGWARFYGAPEGYAKLVSALPGALGGTVVYRNADATIYRVTTSGADQG